MEVHQFGRYLYPAGDEALRRFTRDTLVVPYSSVDRLAGRLPDRMRDPLVPPEARLKRWRFTSSGEPDDIPPGASPDAIDRMVRAFRTFHDAIDSGNGALFAQVDRHAVDRSRWILALDYPQQPRHQVMAVLFNGRTAPEAVLKIRTSETGAADLANERVALERASELPGAVHNCVPRLLGWSCGERNAALLVSWVGGRSAYADVHAALLPRFRVRAHFRAAIGWLLDFQEASRIGAKLDLDQEERIAADSAAGHPEIQETCTTALRLVRALAPPRTLRLVASHGDFWARNVLLDGRARMSGIVDWERFASRSSPFDDLFHFPATYGLAYRWFRLQNAEESWTRTFLQRNHVSSAVRRFLARYCLRWGLQPSLILPLLQLHLIKRHRDAQRRGEITSEGDTVWMQGLRVLADAGDSLFSG